MRDYELDIWIAQNIMGYQYIEVETYSRKIMHRAASPEPVVLGVWQAPGSEIGNPMPPNFSGDLTLAWSAINHANANIFPGPHKKNLQFHYWWNENPLFLLTPEQAAHKICSTIRKIWTQ